MCPAWIAGALVIPQKGIESLKSSNATKGFDTPAGAVENLAVPAAVVVLLAVGIAAAVVTVVLTADNLGFVVAAAAAAAAVVAVVLGLVVPAALPA